MALLLAIIFTPIVFILGCIVLYVIYYYIAKINPTAGKIVVIAIISLIFIGIFTNNIKENSDRNYTRNRSYDEYRESTGKQYMTDLEVNNAMSDEAEFKADMEQRINN